MRAATEDYYRHPAGSAQVTSVPALRRPHHSLKGGGPRRAVWSCIWAWLSRQCQAAVPTGHAKEVQALQHGRLQDPALGLGKQFVENPDGQSSRTWLEAGKQEAAVGGASSRHTSRSLSALLHPDFSQESDVSTLLTRLTSL